MARQRSRRLRAPSVEMVFGLEPRPEIKDRLGASAIARAGRPVGKDLHEQIALRRAAAKRLERAEEGGAIADVQRTLRGMDEKARKGRPKRRSTCSWSLRGPDGRSMASSRTAASARRLAASKAIR